MFVVDENKIEEEKLPGRMMKWLVTKERTNSKFTSVCVIKVSEGEKVKPAHSHPEGEEVIYIIEGSGEVLINKETYNVHKGCAILFPQNSVHMLKNTGKGELKVVCFFAPPTNIKEYKYFYDVDF